MPYTKTAKPETVWDKIAKLSTDWTKLPIIAFLLQEMGDYLLQENGSKIVLEDAVGHQDPNQWTKVAKPAV